MQVTIDAFAEAVEGLRPGFALVTSAHAVIRRFDGDIVAIRVGCDEPLVYNLDDDQQAVAWMEKWKMRLWSSPSEVLRQLPMDMDEISYVLAILMGLS